MEEKNTGTLRSLVSDHDEPVVVDNAPVRIDFGNRPRHPTTSSDNGRTWSRRFSNNLHQIVVLLEDEAGGQTRHKIISHLKGSGASIKFTLARESDISASETLTFSLNGPDNDREMVMTAGNEVFEEDGGQMGRLKAKAIADFRLKEIAIGGQTIPLTSGDRFLHQKVTVVIVGIPE